MNWKLISWNVNGIRAAEKKGFVEWLLASGADLLAVQETKAHPDQLSSALLNPAGYQAAWNSAEKKGYSGTVTYSRHKPIKVIAGLNDSRFDTEGRVLIHEFEAFVFFNIYFPNGGRGPEWVAHKLAFYRRFLAVAQGYMQAGRPVIATGDFNTAYAEIDLARPKENEKVSGFLPEERAWIDQFISHGYIDTFRMFHKKGGHYSWWDLKSGARERNVGWRIDYFFVSENLLDRIESASILPEVMGSDHCPIGIQIRMDNA